jgi:uncharacterized membrane-anchored protein YhcB (DUF1043 family)
MNLLSLILIALGLIVGISVFYIAWELTSENDKHPRRNRAAKLQAQKKEPGESKESKDPPGS